jgi:hypothetical protein
LFQSPRDAQYQAAFALIAGGLGAGGSVGGISLPGVDGFLSWTKIQVDEPFSAADLHGSFARYATLGASFVVGYYGCVISGFTLQHCWFNSQDCSGWGTGLSVVGLIATGCWIFMNEMPLNAYKNPALQDLAKKAVAAGVSSAANTADVALGVAGIVAPSSQPVVNTVRTGVNTFATLARFALKR